MKKKHEMPEHAAAPAGEQPASQPLEGQLVESQEVAALKAERDDLVGQLQRLQAEFNNYRTRIEREQRESKAAASDHLLHELLPISDSLTLALEHAKDGDGAVKGDELLSGLLMINEQFEQLIDHEGLTKIATEGKFDPKLHEAIATIDTPDTEKGTIVRVFQRGWTRGERVFRPAKVGVAK
jgi:molecular chaperone GrpE